MVENLDPPNPNAPSVLVKGDISIAPNNSLLVPVVAYDEGNSQSPPAPWIQLVTPPPGGWFGESFDFRHLPLSGASFQLKFECDQGCFDIVFCKAFIEIGILHLVDSARYDTGATVASRAEDGMRQAAKLELLFDETDLRFVKDQRYPYEGNHLKSRRWYIGIRNASPTKSADQVTVRANECWFVACSVAVAHRRIDKPEEALRSF